MPVITFKNLRKAYGSAEIIHGIDLVMEDHEFTVFVGPSGCGKSTILRMVAGLETVTSGQILMNGKDISQLEPIERDVAMVFQDYALYPHMNVAKNMSFALRLAKYPKAEISQRINNVAAMLGLETLLHRKPGQLSGGQRQRVAMGRALVRDASSLLMDEPLSNLDAKLRVQMRAELAIIRDKIEKNIIYVTHDQVEAMTMADRIVVLKAGNIEQVGSPLELYSKPKNVFVAGFIGSPSMNLLEGPEAVKLGAKTIGIRPEHLSISDQEGVWSGIIGVSEHLGSDTFFHVKCDAFPEPITVRASGEVSLHYGEKVFLTPNHAHLHLFSDDGLRIA